MSDLREFQKKIEEQEKQRIGDVYDECEKRGCDRHFLMSFDTRIWFFPEKQAEAFVFLRNNGRMDKEWIDSYIRQYKTYLEVLIEKRSDNPKRGEWENSLKILSN